MRDFARRFYQSRAWRNTQAAYMASQHYVCERCGELACIVHHVKYLTPVNISDPAVTLNWANLEALCLDCHNAEHAEFAFHTRSSAIAQGLRFTDSGDIEELGR